MNNVRFPFLGLVQMEVEILDLFQDARIRISHILEPECPLDRGEIREALQAPSNLQAGIGVRPDKVSLLAIGIFPGFSFTEMPARKERIPLLTAIAKTEGKGGAQPLV